MPTLNSIVNSDYNKIYHIRFIFVSSWKLFFCLLRDLLWIIFNSTTIKTYISIIILTTSLFNPASTAGSWGLCLGSSVNVLPNVCVCNELMGLFWLHVFRYLEVRVRFRWYFWTNTMMPGENQSKAVGIASEATSGTCQNCTVLNQVRTLVLTTRQRPHYLKSDFTLIGYPSNNGCFMRIRADQ